MKICTYVRRCANLHRFRVNMALKRYSKATYISVANNFILENVSYIFPIFSGQKLENRIATVQVYSFSWENFFVSLILLFHLCFWKGKKKHSFFWETQFKETHCFLLKKTLSNDWVDPVLSTEYNWQLWQLSISGIHPIMMDAHHHHLCHFFSFVSMYWTTLLWRWINCSCAADAAFWAVQQQVAVPGWLC